MSSCDDDLEALEAPVRNRFYYGKEMGVAQFQREQRYHLRLRWLVNRLTIGSRVLCGLELSVGTDGSVTVGAGVAIDGLGREVIVPEAQLLTVEGNEGDSFEIRLCYDECCILPVRAPCGDPCHPNSSVEYDAIQETFLLEVRQLPPPVAGGGEVEESAPGASPDPKAAAAPPCTPPEETCVRVGIVTLTAAGLVVGQPRNP